MPKVKSSLKSEIPVILRQGTWLYAAVFYADNFETLKKAMDNLESDAISVGKLKSLVKKNVVKCSLTFLKLHLSELSTKPTSFEEPNSQLPISEIYLYIYII